MGWTISIWALLAAIKCFMTLDVMWAIVLAIYLTGSIIHIKLDELDKR